TADSASKSGHAVQADNADSLGGIDSSEWQRKHKNNYTAHEDPDLGNDETEGYTEGSIWFNRDTNTAWVCLNAQTNNATWVQTNVSATDLGSAAFVDHGTGLGDVPTNSDMRSLLGSTDLDKGASIVSYSNGLSLQDSFPLIHKTNLVGLLSFSQGEMEGVATQLNEIVSGVYSSPKIYFWDKNY